MTRMIAKLLKELPSWNELKIYARHPRAFSAWLEARSPWLSRRYMGAASNIAEPFTVGMGLSVRHLSEEAIEVALPDGWRNRGDGGLIHSGALAALGETAGRMYWDHHLDFRIASITSQRVQVRILSSPEGALKGVFRLPERDREAILHRLRREQVADLETQTHVYDRGGRLIAEIEIDWRLERQLALGTVKARKENENGDSPNG